MGLWGRGELVEFGGAGGIGGVQGALGGSGCNRGFRGIQGVKGTWGGGLRQTSVLRNYYTVRRETDRH